MTIPRGRNEHPDPRDDHSQGVDRASRLSRTRRYTPASRKEVRMSGDERLRYGAAACQVDFGNPADRSGIKAHVDRMLGMIDSAVIGYAPFLPVKLVVFPEFAHAAPVYETAREL